MPKLTKRYVESIKPPQSGFTQAWDDEIKGLGARIMASGTITYFVYYRMLSGRQRKISIGRHGIITPNQARKRALTLLGEVSANGDPAADREKDRKAKTFAFLAEEYLKRHAAQKKSPYEDERMLNKDLLPKWKHLPAQEISRRDVIRIINEIKDRGAPIAANRTLALVRKIFNFGIDQAIVESNPCFRIKPPGKERKRDRVLKESEIVLLWKNLALTDIISSIQAALKLILITGQRPGEVISAEWSEFDMSSGRWTIPSEKSKNELSHKIPVPPMAQEIIEHLQTGEKYLFPSPKNSEAPIGVNALSHAIRRNLAIIGIKKFTPHDLRRTAASYMAASGTPRLVIAKILNHKEKGVTAVYDRHSYDKEKQLALNTWNTRLEQIVLGKESKVIHLKR